MLRGLQRAPVERLGEVQHVPVQVGDNTLQLNILRLRSQRRGLPTILAVHNHRRSMLQLVRQLHVDGHEAVGGVLHAPAREIDGQGVDVQLLNKAAQHGEVRCLKVLVSCRFGLRRVLVGGTGVPVGVQVVCNTKAVWMLGVGLVLEAVGKVESSGLDWGVGQSVAQMRQMLGEQLGQRRVLPLQRHVCVLRRAQLLALLQKQLPQQLRRVALRFTRRRVRGWVYVCIGRRRI